MFKTRDAGYQSGLKQPKRVCHPLGCRSKYLYLQGYFPLHGSTCSYWGWFALHNDLILEKRGLTLRTAVAPRLVPLHRRALTKLRRIFAEPVSLTTASASVHRKPWDDRQRIDFCKTSGNPGFALDISNIASLR